jgi:hypothetical protein
VAERNCARLLIVFLQRASIDQSYVTGSQWPQQIGRCFLNSRRRVKFYNFARAEATLSLLMPISVTPNFLVMVSIVHTELMQRMICNGSVCIDANRSYMYDAWCAKREARNM